ncbi:MAG: DUF948 domain-containing protein [Armatimonadota bacterium]
MTTFSLIITLSLAVLGIVTLVTLLTMAILALNTTRVVLQMMEQVRPLTGNAKKLAATTKKMAGTVQHASKEIVSDVRKASNEVGHRANRTAWLYRRTLFSPVVAVLASFAGVRQGVAIMRAARRLRQVAPRHAPERVRVRREEVEEQRRAA